MYSPVTLVHCQGLSQIETDYDILSFIVVLPFATIHALELCDLVRKGIIFNYLI